MQWIRSLILCVGFLAAIGCGDSGKIPMKEATAEDIQQQKEAESRAKSEESEMRKKQPKEKTHDQTVGEEERNRKR